MDTHIKTWIVVLTGVSSLAGCTNIPTRIHDPGINIEPVSSETGQIRSVGFWTDRNGLSLRGEVVRLSDSSRALDGHIDVAITVPDRSSTVCTTAQLYRESGHGDVDFSHPFVTLPPRGSYLRVWYHPATESHDECAN